MQTHTVVRGDTLGALARHYYGDGSRYPLIVAANAIADPDRLAVGRKLVIPDVATAAAALRPLVPPPAPGAEGTPRVDPVSAERLSRVHPILAARTRSLLEICAHRAVHLLVTQGLRTWAEQDALYAKGRSVPPIGKSHVVTNARGGQSYHNFGLAVDIVVLDALGKAHWDTSHPGWQEAAQVGRSLGLEWGGDWRGFKDMPHFQYTGGLSLARCRELHEAGGLAAIWEQVT